MNFNLWLREICLISASVAAFASAARSQSIFYDGFEDGGLQWTESGYWHTEPDSSVCGALRAPFPSAPNAAWFGHSTGGCNFSSGGQSSNGNLTLSAPIRLPDTPGQTLWLRYKNALQSEQCLMFFYDSSTRYLSLDAGANWISLGKDCGGSVPSGTAWHKGRAELTQYAGLDVQLRFEFSSGDEGSNSGFGWWIDDVEVRAEAGRPFCDASAACPCGSQFTPLYDIADDPLAANVGGCHNSSGTMDLGAELYATGVPSIGQDDVVLLAEDMIPGTSALFVQASQQTAPNPISDGVLCLGGQILRLAIRSASDGTAAYPLAGDAPLSATANANEIVRYQVYYRDASAHHCTPSTFNFTNGYAVRWIP